MEFAREKRRPDKQQATGRSVKIHTCQSGASGIKRKWQYQTSCREERNVKDKEFQEITESTAVPARLPGVVPIGFPFSL
jgi:hypothetical protein